MSALICYIDILGFGNKLYKQSPDKIVEIMDVLEDISQFFNQVRPLHEKINDDLARLNLDLINNIKIDVFNDSILIIGDVPTDSLARKQWNLTASTHHFIDIYLMACSYIFCRVFTSFGLMSRGAIVYGEYQRRNKDGFNAILSSDVIEAVLLEKGSKFPRIIIGDSAINFFRSISVFEENLEDTRLFVDAGDKKICLDVIKNVLFNVHPEVLKGLKKSASLLHKDRTTRIIRLSMTGLSII